MKKKKKISCANSGKEERINELLKEVEETRLNSQRERTCCEREK